MPHPLRAFVPLALLAALALLVPELDREGKVAAQGLFFPKPLAGGICQIDAASEQPNQMLAPLAGAACVGGTAAGFPCQNVELLALVPSRQLSPPDVEGIGLNGNAVWGWAHPTTGAEYAIVGLRKGTAFVNVTEPTAPAVVGFLRTAAEQPSREIVRDVKVYANHALITSETQPHGVQVVDLMRLPDVVEVARYADLSSAHNLVVNEASGYAYAVGSYSTTRACGTGLHVIDIRDPRAPTYAGCFQDETGYIHDAQCVTYPSGTRHAGREICFAASSSSRRLTIIDVTDKGNMVRLASVPYDGSAFTHQTWLTPDYRYLLMNDEQDERLAGVPTSTLVWDVSELASPRHVATYVGATRSIDHNLYIRGDRAFLSNYRAGLHILDINDPAKLSEVGYFDIYPTGDEAEYGGAWAAYPFLPSGNVLVNGMEQGLFILRPTGPAVPHDYDLLLPLVSIR